jgi:4'-phosphopantetheinyl transferase EntD
MTLDANERDDFAQNARHRIAMIEPFFAQLRSFGCAVSAGSSLLQPVVIRPDEEPHVVHAAPQRRLEFGLGRTLARTALSELGLSDTSIPAGPDRAPVWPQDIIGSITHCDDVAVAAVALHSPVAGMIGIDIERTTSTRDLVDVISTPREQQMPWFNGAMPPDQFASLLFSAKESAYKAFYPCLRRFLDFTDVELALDPSDQRFTARLAAEPASSQWAVRGRYQFIRGYVMTYVIAGRDDSGPG